jgi:YD repeat-containing protein
MKPLFLRTITTGLLLIILQLNNGCNKNNEAVPENACKLLTYTSTGTTTMGTSSSSVTYDYNDKRLMAGYSGTSVDKDKTGVELAGNSSTTSYQYDADGYLIKQLNQFQGTSKADGARSGSNTTDYQYQNGRLTKQTYAATETTKGKTNTRNVVYKYEYDAQGNTTKLSYIDTYNGTAYSSANLYEWKDKKIAKIINIDASGIQTMPFIDVNANGYITKKIDDGGYETRYTYDSEGQQLRREDWYSGKKQSAYDIEYDTQKSWGLLASPIYKGVPQNNFYGQRTHNTMKYTYFTVDGLGQEKISSIENISYQYNTKGYPTGYSSTSTNGNASNVTLTYKDCQ